MKDKQNSALKKKEGYITRADKNSSASIVETMLEQHKARTGNVVRIVIDDRTTIEVSANLSEDERNARVTNYKRTHNLK